MSQLDPRSLLRRDSLSLLSFLTYTMPVEPIAILTTVLATARAINGWLKDKDRKQSIIDDLTKVTQNLCDILLPLQKSQLNKNVLSVLLEIAEALTSTKEHLALWQAKTTSLISFLGFISPAKVVEFLKDDQEKLKERIMLLTLALQVAAMPRINTNVEEAGKDAKVAESPKDYLEEVANEDVREFWKKNFQQDIFVFDSAIPPAISQWANENIDECFGNALMRAIDTKDIGVTTPKSLADFARGKTIKEAALTLKNSIAAQSDSASTFVAAADAPPTLVWIDDNPQNNSMEVLEAQRQGVNVIQIPSTAVAKIWIEENRAYLKQLELANKLRFITDNARWERDSRKGEFMNLTAGEWTLRFLRGSRFTSPVLVFCGASIPTTQYVLRFSHAGSTVRSNVCLAFIKELVTDGDTGNRLPEWEGFNKG